jgi:hypothetical protein
MTASNTDSYQTSHSLDNVEKLKAWMPSLLQVFISTFVGNKIKSTALGHLFQAVRPNTVVAPLLFGVGISLYNFGSKCC